MPVILALILAAGLETQPKADQPAGTVKPTATEPLPPPDQPLPSVDSVLTRLETADQGLTSLSAALSLVKRPPAIEGGGMQVRYGLLHFAAGKDGKNRPVRRFAIHFDKLLVDGRERDDKQSFVFDGHHLLETHPTQRQFVRRHIVGDDQRKDPLRIGEGPFPIPVGQKKADLVARFEIAVVPPLESAPDSTQLRRILFNCIQIKLIPKPGTEQARAFSEVRMWYAADDMMPVFALTQDPGGATTEVFLNDVKKNPPIPPAAFSTVAPSAKEGWNGEEQDMRDKAEMAPGDPTATPRPTPASPAAPSAGTPLKPSEPAPAQPK
ncbi:MAG: hypothetical protein K2Q09_12170 [Phycisphaerales bacterium]|nr:hypothetical protein [Phycisphaerales bacterium]